MVDSLTSTVRYLIESKYEGDYWDFKQEWHKDNERLLHDILCFANTLHNKDCYIIVGVTDNGDIVGVDKENRMKQANIIDLLSNTVFAGDNTPVVKVNTVIINGMEIDVLTIFNSFNIPYYLKRKSKKYKNIKEGYVYTRNGDRNTPISQNSTIQQIELLWKKRLGLTQPPLFQIVNRLENKLEWVNSDNTYYNMFNPDFKLVEEYDDDRKTGEFYVYSQSNSKFMYKDLKIMYNQTILKEFQLVILDSGKYKTPIPNWGFVGHDEWGINHKYTYKYYLKDSTAYKLQQFYFDISNEEEVFAKRDFDEVILYFDNEQERTAFESYIEENQELVESYLAEAEKVYFMIDTSNELEASDAKQRLSVGLALNKALQNFRKKP